MRRLVMMIALLALLTGTARAFSSSDHSSQGAVGPTGATGPAGPTGATGPAGLTGNTFSCPNEAGTGTTINHLVKFAAANPSTCIIIPTTDQANLNLIAGICIAGCGKTGNATIQTSGLATCVFDTGGGSGTVSGHTFGVSAETAGDCEDFGAPSNSTKSGTLGGWVLQNVGAGGGSAQVDMQIE